MIEFVRNKKTGELEAIKDGKKAGTISTMGDDVAKDIETRVQFANGTSTAASDTWSFRAPKLTYEQPHFWMRTVRVRTMPDGTETIIPGSESTPTKTTQIDVEHAFTSSR